jgi:superfamily II DNA or RNA helicase
MRDWILLLKVITMINFDVVRDSRQEVCTDKWKNNAGIGCIDACPRFGKTNVGLKVIHKRRTVNPNSNVLILTPSEIVEKVWKELKLSNTIVLTSNKAKNDAIKLISEQYDILIVDELHRFTSDDDLLLLKNMVKVSRFRLGLTGSYPYGNKTIESLFPVVDVITEQEAIENNWISDFIEYNIPVSLTDDEQLRYIKYSELIKETLELFKNKHKFVNENTNLFDSDFDLIMSCYVGKRLKHNKTKYIPASIIRDVVATQSGWSRTLDLSKTINKKIDMYWRPENIYERCKAFRSFITSRTEILINNKEKFDAVLTILNLNPVPTIIYNGSIDFANTLADKLGNDAILYHSKIKSRPVVDDFGNIIRFSTGKVKMFGKAKLKTEAIDGIKSGKYKYLVTVDSLDEGLNLPELEQTIITAGSTNPLKQIQRSSRGKTINFDKGDKINRIFNIYIDDFVDEFGDVITSRDKSKLIERQKQYSHSVKWLNNVEEIAL